MRGIVDRGTSGPGLGVFTFSYSERRFMLIISSKLRRGLQVGFSVALGGGWAASAASQVLINQGFDGSGVDTDVFTFPGPGGESFFGRTQLNSPGLPGPFDAPEVADGTLRLELNTYNPFAPGSFFLAEEIRTIQTFAPTIDAGFTFETRARFVDDAGNPLAPGLIGGAFLFGLAPTFPDPFVRDEVDFELLSNVPQGEISTNIFNDQGFSSSGDFDIHAVPGLNLTQFNDFRIESTLEATSFFVNDQLVRRETENIAVDPQDFRLNINAQGPEFSQAFSPLIQPTAVASENQTFIFEVDSLVITQFDPDPPLMGFDAVEVADFTGPDFAFETFFDQGTVTPEGFAVSLPASGDNFGGVTVSDNLLVDDVLLTPDTQFLVEAVLGPGNDTDLVLGLRESDGEFFSITIPAAQLADDGVALVTVGDFFFNGDTADGVPNQTLTEVSVQSPFGSGLAVDVLIQGVSLVLAATAALPGDFNGDGFVGQSDLDLVLLNFGDSTLPADFNQAALNAGLFDGLIGQNELDLVLLNFGSGSVALVAVPEPSALLLLTAGSLALGRRRQAP